MILPKIKKISLLVLLVLVSFVLSAFKFISGSKGNASKAQAQCWSAPLGTTSGTTAGNPDACVTTGGTTGTTAGTTEGGY